MSPSDEEVIRDPARYGRADQPWHPDFVAYIVAMATHPVYEGMPDAIKDDGKIQWEAPSNRPPGRYQNTHHKRRDWWREKARSMGIDPESAVWISETAKRIHPTGEKPCKRCGRVMRIAYAYPNGHLLRRLSGAFPQSEFDPLEPITDLLQRLVDQLGTELLDQVPDLLRTKDIAPPELGSDLDAWISWLEEGYIPSEPSLLSPGAMSNAPDRFDGFHSFNLCCRKTADRGRHDSNMRSYSTDRRVFEYWSEGDWIAADRMMGLVASVFRDHPCADGGDPPCTADHIGPLSLGFMHRPEFRLLSKPANSAKNNRMSLWDVEHLKSREDNGEQVVSWYAKPLWDLRKTSVVDEETALRLSKLLRDNQRNAMRLLGAMMDREHLAFLATLLELEYADRKVEFENLRIENFVTVYDSMQTEPRTTKYAAEQKARRLRIGLESLRAHNARDNRHLLIIEDDHIEAAMREATEALSQTKYGELNKALEPLILGGGAGEHVLRELSGDLPSKGIREFAAALKHIETAMGVLGDRLSALWEDSRYVRAAFDFDQD